MKKVSFGGNRPTAGRLNPDDWVLNRKAKPTEPMKRLTIDVPVSLHKRIKSQCALNDFVMADVIREMLEQRFPEQQAAREGADTVAT